MYVYMSIYTCIFTYVHKNNYIYIYIYVFYISSPSVYAFPFSISTNFSAFVSCVYSSFQLTSVPIPSPPPSSIPMPSHSYDTTSTGLALLQILVLLLGSWFFPRVVAIYLGSVRIWDFHPRCFSWKSSEFGCGSEYRQLVSILWSHGRRMRRGREKKEGRRHNYGEKLYPTHQKRNLGK